MPPPQPVAADVAFLRSKLWLHVSIAVPVAWAIVELRQLAKFDSTFQRFERDRKV
jgi:hypothetical protein